MKCMWAPWRIEYILKAREAGCFLCDIIQSDDDRSHLVLKRGDYCVLLMNRYPYNNGHLMIAPYRHVDCLERMNEKELLELMVMASKACGMLRKTMKPGGFNLGINLGKSAGAGLKDHIHMHLVPRWEGDTNFMPVIANAKVIPQSLDELWQQLHNALKGVKHEESYKL